jgi:hypothetical protein
MKLKALLVAGVLAVMPMAAGASVVLDDFTVNTRLQDSGISLDDYSDTPSAYLWTQRRHEISPFCLDPDDNPVCEVTSDVGSGEWTVSATGVLSTFAILTYSFDNVDLTSLGRGFAFRLDNRDANSNTFLSIDVSGSSLTGYSKVLSDGDNSYFVGFDSFGIESVFSDVSAVSFSIIGADGTDTKLTSLSIVPVPVSPVPVPVSPSIAFGALAIGGLALYGRRQRKAAGA